MSFVQSQKKFLNTCIFFLELVPIDPKRVVAGVTLRAQ